VAGSWRFGALRSDWSLSSHGRCQYGTAIQFRLAVARGRYQADEFGSLDGVALLLPVDVSVGERQNGIVPSRCCIAFSVALHTRRAVAPS